MNRTSKLILILFIVVFGTPLKAQDDLLALAEENAEKEPEKPISAFMSSRLVLGHSVETFRKGEMIILISHRFDRLNLGAYDAFGIDNANIRIGFEYGVSDKLSFGHGRSSSDKAYDTYMKYKILQQKKNGFPFTATALVGFAVKTSPKNQDPDANGNGGVNFKFDDRIAYNSQLLIAKRFADFFSLQLMPTYIHKNNIDLYDDVANGITENGTFLLGLGSSVNVTKTFSVNLEYYLRPVIESTNTNYDAFSLGFNLDTGGHVFQFHFSNSFYTNDRATLTEVEDDFWNGDVHFGFNISRTFQF